MKKSKVFWGYAVIALVIYAVVQLLITTEVIDLYYKNMSITMCINIMLAVSLHIVIGVTGQFSIGHAGFLAVGAYVSAIITTKLMLPFPLAILFRGCSSSSCWSHCRDSNASFKRGLFSDCHTRVCRDYSYYLFKYGLCWWRSWDAG